MRKLTLDKYIVNINISNNSIKLEDSIIFSRLSVAKKEYLKEIIFEKGGLFQYFQLLNFAIEKIQLETW